MVIGLGNNKETGRRCVLITLNEADVMKLITEGIELSVENHFGFPDDIELCLAVADDGYAASLAIAHNPGVDVIKQNSKHSES